MNSFLQKGIIIASLIISLSVGWYFLSFLPKDAITENERKCQEAGRFTDKIDTENDTENSVSTRLETRFKFDKKSNKCLYKSGFIQNGRLHKYIRDVYTNEIISDYSIENGQSYGNKEEFDKTDRKYFEE